MLLGLYGRLPRAPLEYRRFGSLVVVSFCVYVLFYCIFIYLYCLASILRSSSACHLDTAAGLLSVAYPPFGTVSVWLLAVPLDDEHCWWLPFLSSDHYPLV